MECGVREFVERYCYFKEIPLCGSLVNKPNVELLPFAELEKVIWLAFRLWFCATKGSKHLVREEFHPLFIAACDKSGGIVSLVPNFKMGRYSMLAFMGVRLKPSYLQIPGYEKSDTYEFRSKEDCIESKTISFILKHLIFLSGGEENFDTVFAAYRYFIELAEDEYFGEQKFKFLLFQYIPRVFISDKLKGVLIRNVKFSFHGIEQPKMLKFVQSERFKNKIAFDEQKP